jgi:hypothetical protein
MSARQLPTPALRRVLFCCTDEAVFKEKHGVWDPMLELTITSPYIESRVDLNPLRVDFVPQSGTKNMASDTYCRRRRVAMPWNCRNIFLPKKFILMLLCLPYSMSSRSVPLNYPIYLITTDFRRQVWNTFSLYLPKINVMKKSSKVLRWRHSQTSGEPSAELQTHSEKFKPFFTIRVVWLRGRQHDTRRSLMQIGG